MIPHLRNEVSKIEFYYVHFFLKPRYIKFMLKVCETLNKMQSYRTVSINLSRIFIKIFP